MNLRDQNLVIELVDFKRNIVLGLMRGFTRRLQFCMRNVILCSDFQKGGERLCQLRAAGGEVAATLIND